MATTEVLFNPLLPEFHANPYPFYHQLREKDPVHETSMGFWVLTRYDDVVMSLRDPRFGREAFEPLLAAMYGQEGEQGRLPRSMLFRDPPTSRASWTGSWTRCRTRMPWMSSPTSPTRSP